MESSRIIKPRFFCGAAIILNPEGKIFLVKKRGKLTLPTGKMETGDKDLIEALIREMGEEIKYRKTGIGIKASVLGSLGTIVYDKESPEAVLFEVVRFTVDENDLMYSEGGETFFMWADIDAVLQLKEADRLAKDAVSMLLNYLNKHILRAQINGGKNEEGNTYSRIAEEDIEVHSY